MTSGFRLFRLFGIDVHLHWTWFLVAWFVLRLRAEAYDSIYWAGAEYLTLFGIVLLHEFGHALACRSVGGRAERIMLWPLGGVAFVSPPPRPGALLWSIAAGPLVNVVLVPVTIAFIVAASVLFPASADLAAFALSLAAINLIILIFNMLPIYPLDGGQILHALLWFVIGQTRGLFIAALIGLIGAAGLLGLAIVAGDWILIAIAIFIGFQAWSGFSRARMIDRVISGPRHESYACPHCRRHPPAGAYWACQRCSGSFDVFENQLACPNCGDLIDAIPCVHCAQVSHPWYWRQPVVIHTQRQTYTPG